MFHRSASLTPSTMHTRGQTQMQMRHGNNGGSFHSNNENLLPAKSLKALGNSNGGGKNASVFKSAKTPGTGRRRALGDISNNGGGGGGGRQPFSSSKSGSKSASKGLKSSSSNVMKVQPLQLLWNDENAGAASSKNKKTLKAFKPQQQQGMQRPSSGQSKKALGMSLRSQQGPSKSVISNPRRKAVDFDIPKQISSTASNGNSGLGKTKNLTKSHKPLVIQFAPQVQAVATTTPGFPRKTIDVLADVEFPAGRTWQQQLKVQDDSRDDGLPGEDVDGDDEMTMKIKRRMKQQQQQQRRELQAMERKVEASIDESLKKQDEAALNELLDLADDLKIYNDLDMDDGLSLGDEKSQSSVGALMDSFLLDDDADEDSFLGL
mmetsp:Transcript_13273/g.36668  ORF Transcript_13273/g.36668 Transcript_13273/m.36668 type:complete len:377 (-) Transcript_13273:1300-2430(-)